MKISKNNHLHAFATISLIGFGFLGSASASLIAHYDFADGNLLDNEVGSSYTLSMTNTVTTNTDGSAHFDGDDGNGAYLEVVGPGGAANFTVSFWFKTDNFSQGSYQGIFSNNNSTGSYSWQFDDSSSNLRLVSSGNTNLNYPDSNLATDTWYNVVIRKESGTANPDTQVYISALGDSSPALVMSQDASPGGLQMFRLGINRSSDHLFKMDMSNVKIYNDSTVNLNTLLSEGPQTVPEPTSAVLLGLGGVAFILRRKR